MHKELEESNISTHVIIGATIAMVVFFFWATNIKTCKQVTGKVMAKEIVYQRYAEYKIAIETKDYYYSQSVNYTKYVSTKIGDTTTIEVTSDNLRKDSIIVVIGSILSGVLSMTITYLIERRCKCMKR